jgi:hypothetical protein
MGYPTQRLFTETFGLPHPQYSRWENPEHEGGMNAKAVEDFTERVKVGPMFFWKPEQVMDDLCEIVDEYRAWKESQGEN